MRILFAGINCALWSLLLVGAHPRLLMAGLLLIQLGIIRLAYAARIRKRFHDMARWESVAELLRRSPSAESFLHSLPVRPEPFRDWGMDWIGGSQSPPVSYTVVRNPGSNGDAETATARAAAAVVGSLAALKMKGLYLSRSVLKREGRSDQPCYVIDRMMDRGGRIRMALEFVVEGEVLRLETYRFIVGHWLVSTPGGAIRLLLGIAFLPLGLPNLIKSGEWFRALMLHESGSVRSREAQSLLHVVNSQIRKALAAGGEDPDQPSGIGRLGEAAAAGTSGQADRKQNENLFG